MLYYGKVEYRGETTTERFYVQAQKPITLNTWVHIAAKYWYDESNGHVKIYVNGIKQPTNAYRAPKGQSWTTTNEDALPVGPLTTNNASLRIGRYPDPYYYVFNGLIANTQVYNTALSDQEIQYLYQQGLGGGPVRLQNLVAWWPLNGDAKDYSGNNNHGTINGGVTFVQNYNPP